MSTEDKVYFYVAHHPMCEDTIYLLKKVVDDNSYSWWLYDAEHDEWQINQINNLLYDIVAEIDESTLRMYKSVIGLPTDRIFDPNTETVSISIEDVRKRRWSTIDKAMKKWVKMI